MNKKALLYSMDDKITPGNLKKIIQLPDLDYAKFQKKLDENKIECVLDGENNYHYKISLIKPKPFLLYYIGNLSLLDNKILGIVGPRSPSIYGQKVLEKLFNLLPNQNFATISGLAPGIDTLTAELSISHQIPTIAVLGGGIFHYQNQTSRYLMQKIIDNGGLILSEFKLDKIPERYTFPQRNRIIAGLSDILFLPEAGIKSGSLITADFALNMSKKIFGTPNGIFDTNSAGLNEYISKGKIIALNSLEEFVAQNFGINKIGGQNIEIKISETEKNILELIRKNGELGIGDIASKLDLDFGKLMSYISNLEINSLITENSPGIYKTS